MGLQTGEGSAVLGLLNFDTLCHGFVGLDGGGDCAFVSEQAMRCKRVHQDIHEPGVCSTGQL